MKYWEYSLPSMAMWASFDFGHVKAETLDGAITKAHAEVLHQLDKVNKALAANPETVGLDIDIDLQCLEIKEVKKDIPYTFK